MIERRSRTPWLAGLCLACVVLAGCSNEPAQTPSGSRQASASQPGPARDALPPPDSRACVGAEAVLGHIAADTVRWSPARNPFDKAVSQRLVSRANDLAAVSPQAEDPQIRSAVSSTAKAFTEVAGAMRSRKRPKVARAIAGSRTVYKELKRVCLFSQN